MPIPQIQMPFHVVTDGGGFHSGHESEAQRDSALAKANSDAEALGIKTRYVAAAPAAA